MIYKINITRQAKEDLKEIYTYIADFLSSINAVRQLDRLEKGIKSLNEMPMRFRQCEFEPWKSRGMRIMPVDNFVVFYIPNEDGVVTVVRVMYGGRDIDEQLTENTEYKV